MVVKMAEILGMSLYEFIGLPEPKEKELYGCLYINGHPVLINNKSESFELVNQL